MEDNHPVLRLAVEAAVHHDGAVVQDGGVTEPGGEEGGSYRGQTTGQTCRGQPRSQLWEWCAPSSPTGHRQCCNLKVTTLIALYSFCGFNYRIALNSFLWFQL